MLGLSRVSDSNGKPACVWPGCVGADLEWIARPRPTGGTPQKALSVN